MRQWHLKHNYNNNDTTLLESISEWFFQLMNDKNSHIQSEFPFILDFKELKLLKQ